MPFAFATPHHPGGGGRCLRVLAGGERSGRPASWGRELCYLEGGRLREEKLEVKREAGGGCHLRVSKTTAPTQTDAGNVAEMTRTRDILQQGESGIEWLGARGSGDCKRCEKAQESGGWEE